MLAHKPVRNHTKVIHAFPWKMAAFNLKQFDVFHGCNGTEAQVYTRQNTGALVIPHLGKYAMGIAATRCVVPWKPQEDGLLGQLPDTHHVKSMIACAGARRAVINIALSWSALLAVAWTCNLCRGG